MPFDNRLRLSSLFPINQSPEGQPLQDGMSQMFDINQSNLIGPQSMDEVSRSNMPDNDMDKIRQIYGELYQPEHEGIDRMTQMINTMPERNHPSMLRKIFGGIAQGLGGGPEAYENIAYAPYRREMQDWQTKFKPIEDLANQERGVNANSRQFAQSVVGNQLGQDKLNLAENKMRSDREIQDAKLEVTRFRAAAYDYKQRHPNHQYKTDEQGRLLAVDPTTNKTEYVLDPQSGEPVQSDKLSDEQKMEMQLKNQKELIGIRAGNARQLEGIRQTNRIELDKSKADTKAKAKKEILDKEKTLSVTQDAAAYKLARQQYIADNPRHRILWLDSGEPAPDAQKNDEYFDALTDIRDRYNRIKSRAVGQAPTTTPIGTGNTNTAGAPPPIEQRKKGMEFKFPNGNVGTWDGTKWVPKTVVKK